MWFGALDLRFDDTRPSRLIYWMGDRLRVGKPPRYFTEPRRPTQPPTLSGTGNEYRPKCNDTLAAGSNYWLAHFTRR